MATRTQLFREILRQYNQTQTKNQARLRERKEAIYQKVPRLEELEQSLGMLGTKISLTILRNNGSIEEALHALKEEQSQLEAERQALLDAHRIQKSELMLEYDCALCKDTGFIENERCTCLKKQWMDKVYDQSNVRNIIEVEHFDNFDLRLYDTAPYPGEESTPYENAQMILQHGMQFVSDFGKGDNFLLFGSTGLGKTFLCNCIASDLLKQGQTVLYLTAGQLFRKLEEQRFHREDDEEAREWDEDLMDVDLLLIDDLGTEFMTSFTATELFRILNDRILAKKSILISTNLMPEDLISRYGDRVASRILGEFTSLHFYGHDIRIKRKFH